MDMFTARQNMVEQQVKPLGVLNPRILQAFHDCPRELFVPTAYENLAYADSAIPIGNGKVLLAPNVIGRLLAALNLQGFEQILEVETGTGYLTCLLSMLGLHVTSVEASKPLAIAAKHKLTALGRKNFEIINGNPVDVLLGDKGFDVVVLNGSVPFVPRTVANHLKYQGHLFAVVGKPPIMHACIFTRINEGEWSQTKLFETLIPPLRNVTNVRSFEF